MSWSSTLFLMIFFRRVESVVNAPMVRRSPRLSSRPPVDPSHSLHRYVVSSRPSLSSYNPPPRTRRSISHSPVNILNESGQSVPPSFETGDQVTLRNQEGLPEHLYGEFQVITDLYTELYRALQSSSFCDIACNHWNTYYHCNLHCF